MSEFSDSFHQLTASIITQLIALLQAKFHGNNQAQNPLTTHPTTMLVALSSIIVYYVLHVVLLRSPGPCRFAEGFLVWSGYVSVATLAAAVFPEEAAPFLYAIFGLLSAREVLHMHGQKLTTVDEVEVEVEVEVQVKEEEASKFEICKRCVCLCLEHVCSGLGKLAKLFPNNTSPIPI